MGGATGQEKPGSRHQNWAPLKPGNPWPREHPINPRSAWDPLGFLAGFLVKYKSQVHIPGGKKSRRFCHLSLHCQRTGQSCQRRSQYLSSPCPRATAGCRCPRTLQWLPLPCFVTLSKKLSLHDWLKVKLSVLGTGPWNVWQSIILPPGTQGWTPVVPSCPHSR